MSTYLQDAQRQGVSDIYLDQGTVFVRKGGKLLKTNNTIHEFGEVPPFCEKKSQYHIRLLPQDLSLEALKYPKEVQTILQAKAGLILCFGSSSSGKTSLILHLLLNQPSSRVSAFDTHTEDSSPYHQFSQHVWCAPEEHPDIEVITIDSEESALQALLESSNHIVIAKINANGMYDGLNKLMLYLGKYPQQYVLNLLASYSRYFISTALITDTSGKILPLLGIAQVNESLATQLQQGNFQIIEAFVQKGNVGLNSISSDVQLSTWYQDDQVSMDEASKFAINPSRMRLRADGIIHNE